MWDSFTIVKVHCECLQLSNQKDSCCHECQGLNFPMKVLNSRKFGKFSKWNQSFTSKNRLAHTSRIVISFEWFRHTMFWTNILFPDNFFGSHKKIFELHFTFKHSLSMLHFYVYKEVMVGGPEHSNTVHYVRRTETIAAG